MIIGGKNFDTEHDTYIMAILNVTPDSFSDGGSYHNMDDILRRTQSMIEEGADIIDIGGESTRPGYTQISCQEEIERVLPVIDAIKREFDIPLSVDTYKAEVARAALTAGCHMVNDIWGLKYDSDMAGLIAASDACCVLMHNRQKAVYSDLIKDCINDLKESAGLALAAGIAPDQIILDPGIGFAKSYEENLLVLKNLQRFREEGYPLLLGCSRKSVIGLTLNLPAQERLEGTLVTTALAVMAGCSFVRVHDVAANKRAIRMARAIINAS